MLIRIINGTYGHRPMLANGEYSNYVVPVTRNDPAIEVSDDEAARLIRKGIAIAASAPTAAQAGLTDDSDSLAMGNSPDDSDSESAVLGPGESDEDSLDEMGYSELLKRAKVLGIDTFRVRKREMLIELIRAKEADTSDAPVLGAEEVIE